MVATTTQIAAAEVGARRGGQQSTTPPRLLDKDGVHNTNTDADPGGMRACTSFIFRSPGRTNLRFVPLAMHWIGPGIPCSHVQTQHVGKRAYATG